MSFVNNNNLMTILSNTKDKIENKINTINIESFETTVNEKYTKNTNIPYVFYNGAAVNIGNNIYLLGTYVSGVFVKTSPNYK